MTATLKNVASRAGVSIPTASLILNGRGGRYRPSTRRDVQAAAEALRYRPDAVARRTRKTPHRRDAIGFLIRHESKSRLANTPLHEFLCGINDFLLERDQFMVMVTLTQLHAQDPDYKPRLIAERFVDGIIIESGVPTSLEAEIEHYQIPTVWLNCDHHDEHDCVYPDEQHAGRLATEYLLERDHRHILLLAPRFHVRSSMDLHHYSISDRRAGYEQAMAAAGLDPQVIETREDSDHGASQDLYGHIIDRIKASRSTDQPITGVVCHGLGSVPQLREGLARVGLQCPGDVSLISIEDMHLIRRGWPEVTGISCDRYRMGQIAAEMILNKVDADGKPQSSYVFQGELITGNTVNQPRPESPNL